MISWLSFYIVWNNNVYTIRQDYYYKVINQNNIITIMRYSDKIKRDNYKISIKKHNKI